MLLRSHGGDRRQEAVGGVAIGIDVGGTEVKGLVGNALDTLGPARRVATLGDSRAALVDTLVSIARQLQQDAIAANAHVETVGLAIPGVASRDAADGWVSANVGAVGGDVCDEVASSLGLPVVVGHDVHLGGLAEFSIGAARDVPSAVFLPLGTGLASSLMINRRVRRGQQGISGEVGHLPGSAAGVMCGCGRSGCVELTASARGLERLYVDATGVPARAHEIVAAAERGETAAVEAWARCVDEIAIVVGGLVSVADVPVIVLGGGLSQAGDLLTNSLSTSLTRLLPSFRALPELRLATFGVEAGARGAAIHALRAATTTSRTPIVTRPERPAAAPIYMLAFDHRASTSQTIFGASPEGRPNGGLSDIKELIGNSAVELQQALSDDGRVCVLTDPESGLQAAREASLAGVPTALALEESGRRDLKLLDSDLLARSLDETSPTWGKVLLRWNPFDPEPVKAEALAALEAARSLCADKGVGFLLELIVAPTSNDLERVGGDKGRFEQYGVPTLLPDAVAELSRRIGAPDIWKVQASASRASALATAEASRSTGHEPAIVVLGGGSDRRTIAEWFAASAHVGGYRGFAIGRTIWMDAVTEWIAGRVDADAAARAIRTEFYSLVDAYRIAAMPLVEADA